MENWEWSVENSGKNIYKTIYAGVVQLARTFPCQGRGCGFESRRLLHIYENLRHHKMSWNKVGNFGCWFFVFVKKWLENMSSFTIPTQVKYFI